MDDYFSRLAARAVQSGPVASARDVKLWSELKAYGVTASELRDAPRPAQSRSSVDPTSRSRAPFGL
ncbi:MAG: hypothetical protein JKP96_04835 [Oceanicaulis sp.]|jgi:hypothetical protein|nr:hypothetical protein [Oceanicaulis sp.]